MILMVGLGAALVMVWVLAMQQHAGADRDFSRRADLVQAAVKVQADRYMEALSGLAAATGAFTPLTASKFDQITTAAQGMNLAGATSVVFVTAADDAQTARAQSLWRSRGAGGLVLKPAGDDPEHLYTVFAVPLTSQTTSSGNSTGAGSALLTGTDLSPVMAPAAALLQARRSGQVAVSDTYHLLRDAQVPLAQRQMSFVLTAPVYAAADAQGRRAFEGWVLMGLRGQDFMGATLRQLSQNLLDVRFSAQNTDQTLVTVAASRSPVAGHRDLNRVVEVQVADRRWHLQIQAVASTFPGAGAGIPIAVGAGLAVLTILLAALVLLLATGRDRAQAAVAVATAQLREQKTLLEAVMDSVGEGIVVIDQDGGFILTNPAAAPFLAGPGQPRHESLWDPQVQLYRPDGVTAVDFAQAPTTRALSGHSSQGVELIQRRAGTPDIVLSVSARPLDRRAGRSGAVGVFTDITARKQAETDLAHTNTRLTRELELREQAENDLRAREEELRVFAGTVAHDLKAPLRSVSGFTMLLSERLSELMPQGLDEQTEHTMSRITTGARQMSQLIDDLLAFAIARDRALRLQPVDLQDLVQDVLAEATGSQAIESPYSPGGPHRGGPGVPPAEISVGSLSTVMADPMMCRQLLSNLIGNALKYTAPGQGAHISIGAYLDIEADKSPWVHLDIADRGVGIPEGEHEHVFTAFKRAHAGYSGSGLGLAICQRIVQRHGGTITVTDNPGGGSCFHITLPAASSAAPRPPHVLTPTLM